MKSLKKYAPLVAVLAAVIALVMIFLPALAVEKETYNGIKAVFGYSKKSTQGSFTVQQEILKFSVMNLLTYVLVIVGGLCAFLSAKDSKKTIFSLIAAICLLVAGVFFFLTVNFTVIPENPLDLTAKDIGFELGVGAIIGGIVSIIGALFASVPAVSKMLK